MPPIADVRPPERLLRRGLEGHLKLVCTADSRGRTFIREQSFRAPIHLSKPHLDGDLLVVNIVNPTAGLLAGDRIRYEVTVDSGAQLLLTTSSASRAHASGDEWSAVEQAFRVSAGAWLETWPELFIPQRGSRYRQRTTVALEPGGELLMFETLAPGRVATGESFAFTALDWETTILYGGERIAHERYRLDPEQESVMALRQPFSAPYYASCFVISPVLSRASECWGLIHGLHEDAAWIGCGELVHDGWVIKVVTEGSVLLRRKLAAIRRILYRSLGRAEPALRRAGELQADPLTT